MSEEQQSGVPEKSAVAERLVVQLDHLAVHTSRGEVVQYPQAATYHVNDNDELLLRDGSDEKNLLVFYRSSEWEAVYLPGTIRLKELFSATEFSEGSESAVLDEN